MSTITATSLDSLLHAGEGASPTKKPSRLRQQGLHSSNEKKNDNIGSSTAAVAPWKAYYISPALYATPEPASIPGSSPTPDAPSPYVLNHKRRAPSSVAPSPVDASENQQKSDSDRTDETPSAEATAVVQGGREEVTGEGKEEDGFDVEVSGEQQKGEDDSDGEEEEDEFFDPRESMSVGSSSDAEDGSSRHRHRGFGSHTPSNYQSDFCYPGEEDDNSASQATPFSTSIEMEMRALRCSLSEEIGRCRKAEEALHAMHEQWKNVAKCLSQTGLLLSDVQHAEDLDLEINPEAVVQEILVSKLVSEAVERAIAQAEAEAVAEAVIDAKDHEISRLRDRLQYYEAVNHSMSQRNQEAVELARQQRLRWKARRKWIWGCIGLSITIGASLLCSNLGQMDDET